MAFVRTYQILNHWIIFFFIKIFFRSSINACMLTLSHFELLHNLTWESWIKNQFLLLDSHYSKIYSDQQKITHINTPAFVKSTELFDNFSVLTTNYFSEACVLLTEMVKCQILLRPIIGCNFRSQTNPTITIHHFRWM